MLVQSPLLIEVLTSWPKATQVSHMFCCHPKAKLEQGGRVKVWIYLNSRRRSSIGRVSFSCGHLPCMPGGKFILVLSIRDRPWGLPVSRAVVVSGTTKSKHLTAFLTSLHSRIPKELKTAASPVLQTRSRGTEMPSLQFPKQLWEILGQNQKLNWGFQLACPGKLPQGFPVYGDRTMAGST